MLSALCCHHSYSVCNVCYFMPTRWRLQSAWQPKARNKEIFLTRERVQKSLQYLHQTYTVQWGYITSLSLGSLFTASNPQSLNVKLRMSPCFTFSSYFPPHHKFHKILNRNNVKVSYSCMPNIHSIIKSYNSAKILHGKDKETQAATAERKMNVPTPRRMRD